MTNNIILLISAIKGPVGILVFLQHRIVVLDLREKW